MENEYLLVAVVILFSSFTQGFAGFGFQLIAVSILTLLFNPKEVIPICALFGLVINIYLSIQFRDKISIKEVWPLIIGSAFGIPFGLFFLKSASIGLIKISIGIILILYIIVSAIKNLSRINIRNNAAYFFGFFSGVLGGAINTNGPPIIIYLLLKNYHQNIFKAIISIFFLFSSLMIVIGHLLSGFTTTTTLRTFLFFLPIVLAGNYLGIFLYSKLPLRYFDKIIKLLLFAIALKLIFT